MNYRRFRLPLSFGKKVVSCPKENIINGEEIGGSGTKPNDAQSASINVNYSFGETAFYQVPLFKNSGTDT